jgi:tetratricopeptide (TPR) repeat protein
MAGPDATVILASDHGFRTGENRPAGSSRIGEGRAAEWHRKYGILVMAGPGISAQGGSGDASVLDVAPTILALLGLPVPAYMDGQILTRALDPEFLRRYPPIIEGGRQADRAGLASPVASSADEAIVQRLRSLGYIGADEVGSLAQDDASSFNNRAAIHLVAGDGEKALLEVDRGLALAPDSPFLLVNRARALRLLDRDQEALDLLLAVLAERPELASVENLVGNIYMDRGDLVKAATHFRQALAQDPNAAEVLISRGLLAEREGRLEDALADFNRAVAIDPDSAEAHNNIGNVYRTQALQAAARGDQEATAQAFAQAAAAYQGGMKADAEFVGSYNNLALIYQDTGRPDAAMALYQRALQEEPDQAVVHNNLGSLYFAAGRLEEARAEFTAAIAADAVYAEAWTNLGAVRGRLGEPDGELDAYRQAVSLDPDYQDGFHNLGLALLQRGDHDGAETALLRALELQPDYISACVALGDLYRSTGRPQEAVTILTRALAINPRLAELHNRLGEAWLAAGDREQAGTAWRRSLELNGDQPQVRDRLRLLEP